MAAFNPYWLICITFMIWTRSLNAWTHNCWLEIWAAGKHNWQSPMWCWEERVCADAFPEEQSDLNERGTEWMGSSATPVLKETLSCQCSSLLLPNGIQILFSLGRLRVTQEKLTLPIGWRAQAEAWRARISPSDWFQGWAQDLCWLNQDEG